MDTKKMENPRSRRQKRTQSPNGSTGSARSAKKSDEKPKRERRSRPDLSEEVNPESPDVLPTRERRPMPRDDVTSEGSVKSHRSAKSGVSNTTRGTRARQDMNGAVSEGSAESYFTMPTAKANSKRQAGVSVVANQLGLALEAFKNLLSNCHLGVRSSQKDDEAQKARARRCVGATTSMVNAFENGYRALKFLSEGSVAKANRIIPMDTDSYMRYYFERVFAMDTDVLAIEHVNKSLLSNFAKMFGRTRIERNDDDTYVEAKVSWNYMNYIVKREGLAFFGEIYDVLRSDILPVVNYIMKINKIVRVDGKKIISRKEAELLAFYYIRCVGQVLSEISEGQKITSGAQHLLVSLTNFTLHTYYKNGSTAVRDLRADIMEIGDHSKVDYTRVYRTYLGIDNGSFGEDKNTCLNIRAKVVKAAFDSDKETKEKTVDNRGLGFHCIASALK